MAAVLRLTVLAAASWRGGLFIMPDAHDRRWTPSVSGLPAARCKSARGPGATRGDAATVFPGRLNHYHQEA